MYKAKWIEPHDRNSSVKVTMIAEVERVFFNSKTGTVDMFFEDVNMEDSHGPFHPDIVIPFDQFRGAVKIADKRKGGK